MNVDFPYNLGVDYNAGIGGHQAYGGHVNDRKSDVEYRAMLKNIMTNAVSASKENAHFFFWTNEDKLGMMQDLMKECGIDFRRLCAWLRGILTPSQVARSTNAQNFVRTEAGAKSVYRRPREKSYRDYESRSR